MAMANSKLAREGLPSELAMDQVIQGDARALSGQLQALREKLFPPEAKKTLRRFSSSEAARLIGVTDSYLRHLAALGEGPTVDKTARGRLSYSLEQIHAVRAHLAKAKPSYLPNRTGIEHLQTIAVTNFKGGSGKTTTAAHLSQYLALRGYRVLAIDLDPQSSLSALLGYQPETDVGENETLYGALRYDDQRRSLREVAKHTYFPGLDIVPGNLELQEFEHETPRMLAGQRRSGQEVFFARVASAIQSVAETYDVVVIDCPPQLGFLTLGALCAATGVLVPLVLDLAVNL